MELRKLAFFVIITTFITTTKDLKVLFRSLHPWLKTQVRGIHNTYQNAAIIQHNLVFKQKIEKLE